MLTLHYGIFPAINNSRNCPSSVANCTGTKANLASQERIRLGELNEVVAAEGMIRGQGFVLDVRVDRFCRVRGEYNRIVCIEWLSKNILLPQALWWSGCIQQHL